MTERTYAGYTLAQLRALSDAATPGPWQEFCESGDWWIARVNEDGGPLEAVCDSNDGVWNKQEDIECAVATRNALPALCERVAELERLIAKMDAHAPRADRRSIEPGITYSEACRRQLRDDGDPLFLEVRND